MAAESVEVLGETYYCPDHDMDSNPRPFGLAVDIGADEVDIFPRIPDKRFVTEDIVMCPKPFYHLHNPFFQA
jgi:hypothetical protein